MVTPTFENTVGILVKAYLEGTLSHGSCAACAVGNIIAASCGYTKGDGRHWYTPQGQIEHTDWYSIVRDYLTEPQELLAGFKQIEATGYTVTQLARIESAFEFREVYGAAWLKIQKSGDIQYEGLMAVVDVLADIHGIDLAGTQAAKELFVKAA